MTNKKCISKSDYIKIAAPDKMIESDLLNEISEVVKVDAAFADYMDLPLVNEFYHNIQGNLQNKTHNWLKQVFPKECLIIKTISTSSQ